MKNNIKSLFDRLYNDESDAIFRFCLIRVSNRDQALDITQETFLRVWSTLCKGKNILNNKAFLFTVAHRLIIDWYRKKKSISLEGMTKKDMEVDYYLLDESTQDILGTGLEGKYLLSKINELNPVYRDPVYLYFVEDLSAAQIGEVLGLSSNVISVRVNRGIKELRRVSGY